MYLYFWFLIFLLPPPPVLFDPVVLATKRTHRGTTTVGFSSRAENRLPPSSGVNHYEKRVVPEFFSEFDLSPPTLVDVFTKRTRAGSGGGADGKETFFEKFINDDESVISVGFCSTTWTVLTSSYRLPGLASRQTVTRFQVVYTNEPLVSPLWCVVFFYGFLGFQHLVQRLQYFNRITERTL